MSSINFQRMMQLAEEAFATKSDPEQLDVDDSVIQQLLAIHPATVSEMANEMGPYAWILLIPTSESIMHLFLQNKISEKELFVLSQGEIVRDAVYLCSAMVLEEFRNQGLATRMTVDAIRELSLSYEVHFLFSWNFSKEGEAAANAVAQTLQIPLFVKTKV